ncbi:TPA: phosphoribosyltransferase family protein [Klebsiella pneumoniae]|uniref:phosphoribosyltransferase family protein n=1 Tax=Klebsiella/Raoultella group TaxID=2890311 RepID=UPI0020CEB9B7|nr:MULTISPECIES: phosphoribosyltransferase family protein [Klebsiella/Raoultella group]HDS8992547.1 hypothetical protein [Klebsiella pneumoniae subsp. pneumoniae]MCJ4958717.1 hypothetical protein [Klebsiella pneumoniae]MCQ0704428.1 hypothetical protein [Klebsiella pneumoniae]MDD1874397.1 hypothetical protein [Klebsiella pneumoniae]MEB4600391.1 phosphoribosyltransferase family protein [Raoultella ornithinolytica]
MKIIDLLDAEFIVACNDLKLKVFGDYKPDLIVGIATGGAVVVDHMGLTDDKKIVIIKRQRPFTKTKNKIKLKNWLPYFPFWLSNIIRRLELSFNEYRFYNSSNRKTLKGDVHFLKGSPDSFLDARKILLVDDSIDSGVTLKECLNFINQYISSETEVRTSSINVTFRKPIIMPDYTLYSRTIVRYPWASDVRLKNEKNSLRS